MNKTLVDKNLVKKKSKIDNKYMTIFLAISVIIPVTTAVLIYLYVVQSIFITVYTAVFVTIFIVISYLVMRSNSKKSKKLNNNEVIITKEQITSKFIWDSDGGPDDHNMSRGTSYYLDTERHRRLSISHKDYNLAVEDDYAYIIYTDNGKFLYAFPCNAYELDNELKYIMEKNKKTF